MDFTQALSYPFKSVAKVITIVLAMTIAFAVFLGMILSSFDWVGYIEELQYILNYQLEYLPNFEPIGSLFVPGFIGLIIVSIVQGLWLSGYSIRVIRSAMDGHEKLPNIQFKVDLLKGFYLFLAGILYALVFIPFFIILVMLGGMAAGPSGEAGLSGLIFCSGFIVAIPLMFVLGWAYFIGMARCAADDNNGALFQVWTNMKIARANTRASMSLTGYQILLMLTYGFLSQFVNNALQVASTPFGGNEWNQTTLMVVFVVPFMLSIAMNIIQQFSNMHLVAQYAYKIGLYDPYYDEFDKL